MTAPGTTVWGYRPLSSEHSWRGAGTRDEAIADGREACEGEAFEILQGVTPKASEFIPDVADWLLDAMSENACDAVGDAAEDWPPRFSREATAELKTLLAAWADRHFTDIPFWVGDGSKVERIPAEPHDDHHPSAHDLALATSIEDTLHLDELCEDAT